MFIGLISECFGVDLGDFLVPLGTLGPPRGGLGGLWVPLGKLLGRLGVLLGRSWDAFRIIFGASGRLLAPPWPPKVDLGSI